MSKQLHHPMKQTNVIQINIKLFSEMKQGGGGIEQGHLLGSIQYFSVSYLKQNCFSARL